MVDTDRQIPPGYRWQLSRSDFRFDIVTGSRNYKKYMSFAEKHGLVRDICRKELNDKDVHVPIKDYIHIEQKSPQWFLRRSNADGTASSVGKHIKGPTMYPTMDQITEKWQDRINKVPFETTHTMRGHMKWGVGYEDPALVHFAVDNMLTVAQVGTIHTPLQYIVDLIPQYFTEEEILELCVKDKLEIGEKHLLVSPDGVVGECDDGPYESLPKRIVGMLEIKCISPFHHVEEKDGTLSWTDDMERRQWYHPGEIPFVYVTQICLQAIAGLYRLNMKDTDTMWFIRWSPSGLSEFKIDFRPLVRMGILASLLYFSLNQRIKGLCDLPLVYTPDEVKVARLLSADYHKLMENMKHRYISLASVYPEFFTYQECTAMHRFTVPE